MLCLKVEGLNLKIYWCFIGEEGKTVSWLRSALLDGAYIVKRHRLGARLVCVSHLFRICRA